MEFQRIQPTTFADIWRGAVYTAQWSIVCEGHRFCGCHRRELIIPVELQRFIRQTSSISTYLHLALPCGVTPYEFCGDIWRQKTRVGAIVWRCLRDPIRLTGLIQYRRVSDRRTDGRTDTRRRL